MNLAEATITQLLIPVDDFERGVASIDCLTTSTRIFLDDRMLMLTA